jgi:hypothetical protein
MLSIPCYWSHSAVWHYLRMKQRCGAIQLRSMRNCWIYSIVLAAKLISTFKLNIIQDGFRILCFVDRASFYNLVNKANLVHNFS